MLTQLHVENFALIDVLDLEFSPGFTVLTGETGAGKSILVDAINALLGERVGGDSVREGCSKSVVQGAFDVAGRPEIAEQIIEQGHEAEDGVILARDISIHGKTQCRVNGRLSTLNAHRDLTQLLADVHGQHEHQLLLSLKWQLQFLDGFVGTEATALKRQLSEEWGRLQQVSETLRQLSSDARERERLADLYRFQVQEIESAGLRPGEEEDLKAENLRLANLEKLSIAAETATAHLAGGEEAGLGAEDSVAASVKALEAVARFDAEIDAHVQSLTEALVRIQEASEGLRAWREDLDVSPGRIDEVQSRLDLISNLKRKYGETIPDILVYLDRVANDLGALETSDEQRLKLESEQAGLQESVRSLAAELTRMRNAAVAELSRRVEEQLADLGMAGAKFKVSVDDAPLGPTGADRVEFLISANAGESARPLSKVASGGESSRIMLALKTVLTSEDPVRTLVFDEVDAGIGGRTANVVGEKLKGLAQGRQVLCVTHLAQIASFADSHFQVQKRESNGRTVVEIRKLSDEERVVELARMLGGNQESEAAVQHARELLSASAPQSR
ncbi:MAG: DNA repair protein RecN [Armatimonadetes bacterium]|nr:DNA repair protein RecN [Armatimonadota bacterium]